jgi:hypothetical protein
VPEALLLHQWHQRVTGTNDSTPQGCSSRRQHQWEHTGILQQLSRIWRGRRCGWAFGAFIEFIDELAQKVICTVDDKPMR